MKGFVILCAYYQCNIGYYQCCIGNNQCCIGNVYIIVKFQKSNYQSCIGNNQCLNDNNQFRIYKYQLLTHWLLPMQDWLLPNVFSARGNNQFSMPLLPMHGFTV